MKTPNFDKFFFRLNIFVTFVVFILIAPTRNIFVSWYPDDERILWLVPLSIIVFSATVWLLTNICLPWLFDKGIFDERRADDKASRYHGLDRWRRRISPILNFLIHMVLIALFCYAVVFLMDGNFLSEFVFYKVS